MPQGPFNLNFGIRGAKVGGDKDGHNGKPGKNMGSAIHGFSFSRGIERDLKEEIEADFA